MFQSLLSKLSGSHPAEQCWQLIEQGVQVLDVRTPQEYASGHLPMATNVPLDQLSQWLAEHSDKQTPFVLYCGAGIRAQKGCEILKAHGFECAINGGALKDLLCYQPQKALEG